MNDLTPRDVEIQRVTYKAQQALGNALGVLQSSPVIHSPGAIDCFEWDARDIEALLREYMREVERRKRILKEDEEEAKKKRRKK